MLDQSPRAPVHELIRRAVLSVHELQLAVRGWAHTPQNQACDCIRIRAGCHKLDGSQLRRKRRPEEQHTSLPSMVSIFACCLAGAPLGMVSPIRLTSTPSCRCFFITCAQHVRRECR